MIIEEITIKIISYSDGNIHDINHLLKVYAFARTIAKCEKLDDKTQKILEIATLIHDIACPLCRKKYGNTNGKFQETEGKVLAREFLSDTNLSQDEINRIVYLVSHHHTYTDVDGIDYRILLESDYLVNAYESQYSKEAIDKAKQTIFRTQTGIKLLNTIYSI